MKARPYLIAAMIGVGGLMLSGCVDGGYYDGYDSYGPGGYYYGGGGGYVYNDVVVGRHYRDRRYYDHRDHGHSHDGWSNGHRGSPGHNRGHSPGGSHYSGRSSFSHGPVHSRSYGGRSNDEGGRGGRGGGHGHNGPNFQQ